MRLRSENVFTKRLRATPPQRTRAGFTYIEGLRKKLCDRQRLRKSTDHPKKFFSYVNKLTPRACLPSPEGRGSATAVSGEGPGTDFSNVFTVEDVDNIPDSIIVVVDLYIPMH